MKKLKNLNEEIARIKSLFSEERLYGNIEEPKLVVEQLKKVMRDVLSAVGPTLKSFDPKLLTKFKNADFSSFDVVSKHLNEFDVIWEAIVKNPKKLESAKEIFNLFAGVNAGKSSKYKNVGEIPEEVFSNYLTGIPKEGGLREQFIDLWLVSKNKTPETNVNPPNVSNIVFKKGDDLIIHEKNLDSGEIVSYKVKEDGNLETIKYDKSEASDDFIKSPEHKSSETLDGGKVTTTEPISTKNIDDLEVKILDEINLAAKNVDNTPKQVTLKDLKTHMKENKGVLFFRGKDGKLHIINPDKIDTWDIILKDVDGVTTIDSIELKIKSTGGEEVKPKGWAKKWLSSVSSQKFTPLRYLFPQSSFVLKKLNWVLKTSNIADTKLWDKPRFTVAPKNVGDDFINKLAKRPVRVAENIIRLGVENLFYGYVYGTVKDYQRSDSITDMTGNPIKYVQDWFNSDLIGYQPILLLFTGLSSMVNNLSFWDNLEQGCVNKCEKQGISSSKVKSSKCYLNCQKKNEELKGSYDKMLVSLEKYGDLLKEIEDLKNKGPEEMKKFCEEGKGGQREKLTTELMNIKDTQKDINEKVKNITSDSKWFELIYTKATDKLKDIGVMDKGGDVVGDVVGELKVGDEKFNESNIDELINKINNHCVNVINGEDGDGDNSLPQENKDVVPASVDGEIPNSTRIIDPELVLHISITPIELIV